MALIDEVKQACTRLAAGHWLELMSKHGLNLAAGDLAAELARPLPKIDRTITGFEDFSLAGNRGIEPGQPARSLLYHAFASPRVIAVDGGPRQRITQLLTLFPSLLEIESVENYVFGVKPLLLSEWPTGGLGHGLPGRDLHAVVFSCEYRPASGTTHRRHADLVFSRAGISHVGTAPVRYDDKLRAFAPRPLADPTLGTYNHPLPVVPARFVVYLATQVKGSVAHAVPMNANQLAEDATGSDEDRQFWLPVHKLFSGRECLAGENLQVTFSAGHVNEKLRRMHLWLQSHLLDSGQTPEAIAQSPFIFSDGIAKVTTAPAEPPGWVVPIVHPRLVEPAVQDGFPLTYRMPSVADLAVNYEPTLSGSLRLDKLAEALNASNPHPDCSEIVHARTKVLLIVGQGVETIDLGAEGDTDQVVHDGDYFAQHYIDYTGDGWVGAKWGAIGGRTAPTAALPAYSIVGAPDCLPFCGEREIWEWHQSLPAKYKDSQGDSLIWDHPPEALSQVRLPANLQLPGVKFSATDLTMTAMVPLYGSWPGTDPELPSLPEVARASWMPDNSAGRREPGWDVGQAVLHSSPAVTHLAAHTLGSPFLEDAKFCAALSAYWPAVGPDVARRYGDRRDTIRFIYKDFQIIPGRLNRTVVPLTDRELGITGAGSWDGEVIPYLSWKAGLFSLVVPRFDQGDYVKAALAGNWWPGALSGISTAQYRRRALGMVQVYRRLVPVTSSSAFRDLTRSYFVIGFADPADNAAELAQAQSAAGVTFSGTAQRFELADHVEGVWSAKSWTMPLHHRIVFYVSPTEDVVLGKKEGGSWQVFDPVS